MKKKNLAACLSALLLLLLLCACGNNSAESTEASSKEQTSMSETESIVPSTEAETQKITTTQGKKGVADGPQDGSWQIGKTAFAWKTYYYSGQEVCRRYYYYIPSTYVEGEKLPVVFCLPGSGTTAGFQIGQGKWTKLAEQEHFIVLAPEYVALHVDGTLSSESLTLAQIGQSSSANQRWVATGVEPVAKYGIDDVQYICDLIDIFTENGYADATRIYATGLSHGAYMCERLALEVPERIAGIGAVAAGLWYNYVSTTPTNRVRIVYIQGTADPIVPYTGIGSVSLPLEDTIKWFRGKYNMSLMDTGITTSLEDTNPSDGCTVSRTAYLNTEGEEQIIEYLITGGGHTWPGGTQYLPEGMVGKLCMDFQASEYIWADLKSATNQDTALK